MPVPEAAGNRQNHRRHPLHGAALGITLVHAPEPTTDLPDTRILTTSSGTADLDTLLVLAHWTEDLSWLRYQPYPAIVYEKHPSRRGDAPHYVEKNVAVDSGWKAWGRKLRLEPLGGG